MAAAESRETVMDCNLITKTIERSALGAGIMGYLGELYDVRSEKFCYTSIFSKPLPEGVIQRREIDAGNISFSEDDSLNDRFQLLKVKGGLKLSLLFGSFGLEGHGKYLNKEKVSERTVSCSLLYDFRTLNEKLLSNSEEIEECIDRNVLDDEQYTHVVTEIAWGAKNTVSLECRNSDAQKKREIQGFLKGHLSKFKYDVSIIDGDGSYESEECSKTNAIRVEVNSDISPKGNTPTTVEEAKEYMRTIPELIKGLNDGKGIPLNYVMLPISPNFRKLRESHKADTTIIRAIDESFTMQLVYFFESIAEKKRKLRDFKEYFEQDEKYLPANYVSDIEILLQKIETDETNMKDDLGKSLEKFKRGTLEMDVINQKVSLHKSKNLNITEITNFIDKLSETKSKVEDIRRSLSRNIVYLGRNDNLDSLLTSSNDDFFVMFTSEEYKKKDPDLYLKSSSVFQSKARENSKEDIKFVVVDFDVNLKVPRKANEVKIHHYKSGRIISHDVYKDYETESLMNLAKVIDEERSNIDYVARKPTNRIVLELPCPGMKLGTCTKDPLIWNCNNCKGKLEYGFDSYFYCSCSKMPSGSYELKCNSSKHGNQYFSVKEGFPLEDELRKLRPFKEINILILGQSGVGKSIWIDSVANHLQCETLENAEKEEGISTMQTNFTDKHKMPIAEFEESHTNQIVRDSSTTEPVTYHFKLNDSEVRLIDTPGLCGTIGIEGDKDNMKKILDYVTNFKEIHGICILLKSNETVINDVFRFCLMEFLTLLPRNAAKNILFCFTDSGSSCSSGIIVTLKKFMRDMKLDLTISLCERTMFWFKDETTSSNENNRVFRLKNAEEAKRLFKQIQELEPYSVEETKILCNARQWIIILIKFISNIGGAIQRNTAITEEMKTKTVDWTTKLEELAKGRNATEQLNHPQNACRNSKFVNIQDIITHTEKMVEFPIVDAHVETKINTAENSNAKILKRKKIFEELLVAEELENKEKILSEICLELALFLKSRSIVPYNKVFENYLQYIIEQKQNSVEGINGNKDTLEHLNNLLSSHLEEKRILESYMNIANEERNIEPEDIIGLEKRIYGLELTDQELELIKEMSLKNVKGKEYVERSLSIQRIFNTRK